MANKGEFHSDSALFMTTITDEKIALTKFFELYENTRNATLIMKDNEKNKIVETSPFFQDIRFNPSMQGHGPGIPIDSVVPCTSAIVACSDNIYKFPASINDNEYHILAPPSGAPDYYPNYGCLASQPCPSWYYMQVSQTGPIVILIQQGQNFDVDFVCWGPFTSVSDGCSNGLTGTCGNPNPMPPFPTCKNNTDPGGGDFYPRGNMVDCSYSGSATETCSILSAQAGEFYILLITNFEGLSGFGDTITFQQTGGTGVTNCNIVVHCSMVAITADPSICDPNTNTFSVSGNVEFSNAPPGGFLTITDNTAVPPVFKDFLPPFTSPYAYTLTGVPCDGLSHSLSAAFSDSTTCTLTQPGAYTSPPTICPTATISGGGAICDDGVSNAIVTITFSGAPPIYNFAYAIDGLPHPPITNYSGPFPYQITTSTPGAYTLLSVSNASCPIGSVSGSVTVVLLPLPDPPNPSEPFFFRCGPGSLTLSVIEEIGIDTKWYDAPVGGNLLFTGKPFITPSISSTTVYYAEAVSVIGSCKSLLRTPITAEIRTVPSVSNPTTTEGICSGGSPTISLVSTPAGASFTWAATVNPAGSVNNFTPSGNGDLTSEILFINPGVFQPGVVTYTVTPTLNSCPGNTTDFAITVNPTPTVNTVANQTFCHNTLTTSITFSGSIPGTQYNWINSNPSIGLASFGSGLISAFTATNITNIPVNATITVTPSFTNSGKTCTGVPTSFIITVNPVPTINTVANQPPVCHNELTSQISFSGSIPGAQYNWINSIPSIGLGASGSGNIPAFTATNITNNPVNATITVTPSFTNSGKTCPGVPTSFTITVNPIPIINAVANQPTVCNNELTSLISFSASVPGTQYNWINSVPSIGLVASGSGNIPAFTATNTSNNPVTATITVTPAFTNSGKTCTGVPTSFTITVNPIPTVNPVANQPPVCQNELTALISFSGSVPGTQYNWINSDPSIGLGVSGSGDISAFTATNATIYPVTATIAVTPVFTNSGKTCTGASAYFTITVNPTPTVNPVANQPPVCHNAPTTLISFSGSVPGTQFNWINSDPSIGLGASGSGAISSFTATNTSNILVTATITVTPVFTNSGKTCPGTSTFFTFTVNPLPGLASTITGLTTVCQGKTGVVYSADIIPNATEYIWNYSGTGTTVPTNTKDILVDYSITATSGTWSVFGRNSCGDGPLKGHDVLVNPKPNASFQVCTPLKTIRNGRKIQLKGGLPLPGLYYSIEGVSPIPGTDQFEFDPSVVTGPFPKNIPITYSYQNSFFCSDEKSQTITVFGLNADIVDPSTMKDLRDDRQYTYASFGTGASIRSWMTQNLNYGTVFPGMPAQMNNCVPEKFCPLSDLNCSGPGGGYYQWDELMEYQTGYGYQDLCPPGWHVPNETEWQTLIDNINPIFPAPSANATVGKELKDPANSFKALLEGINFLQSNTWSFTTGITATMFWTSTMDGNGRAFARGLNNPDNPSISKYASSRANAFPVRCVKN